MWYENLPSSKMGFETTKGSSCSGSMYLCPALRILIWGRQTTRVPGMLVWLWYQLRTVPGMSPQMIVLGEGRLSLGRNTQQGCSSNLKKGRKKRGTLIMLANSASPISKQAPVLCHPSAQKFSFFCQYYRTWTVMERIEEKKLCNIPGVAGKAWTWWTILSLV